MVWVGFRRKGGTCDLLPPRGGEKGRKSGNHLHSSETASPPTFTRRQMDTMRPICKLFAPPNREWIISAPRFLGALRCDAMPVKASHENAAGCRNLSDVCLIFCKTQTSHNIVQQQQKGTQNKAENTCIYSSAFCLQGQSSLPVTTAYHFFPELTQSWKPPNGK